MSSLAPVVELKQYLLVLNNESKQIPYMYYEGVDVQFDNGVAHIQVARRSHTCPMFRLRKEACPIALIIQTIQVDKTHRRQKHATRFLQALKDHGFCVQLQSIATEEGEAFAKYLINVHQWKQDEHANNVSLCSQRVK